MIPYDYERCPVYSDSFFFEKIQIVGREAVWSRDAAARAEFSFWNLME